MITSRKREIKKDHTQCCLYLHFKLHTKIQKLKEQSCEVVRSPRTGRRDRSLESGARVGRHGLVPWVNFWRGECLPGAPKFCSLCISIEADLSAAGAGHLRRRPFCDPGTCRRGVAADARAGPPSGRLTAPCGLQRCMTLASLLLCSCPGLRRVRTTPSATAATPSWSSRWPSTPPAAPARNLK